MDIQPGQITINLGALPLGRVDEYGVDWAIDRRGFDGWGATRSTRRTEQKTRGHGGTSGEGFLAPRAIAVRGRAYAPTPEAARYALDRLNDAASIDDFVYTVNEPGLSRWLFAHRVDDVQVSWTTPTELAWTVGLVADDPRKLHQELSAATGLPSTTGGLTIPYTVPFTINATTVSGQVSLTNPGNIAGPVRLRIDGPVAGPVITHVASGRSLVFSSSYTLGAGQWLDIDMDAHTVLENGQANRRMYVISDDWSGFEPGANTWTFTAATFDIAAALTVYATPADK